MKRNISAFIICVICFTTAAKAGFPIAAGHWLLAPTYNYYAAKGYWNSSRLYTPYANNGRFTSNYLGVYGVYGINRNWNFTFNVPFVIQTYTETNLLVSNSSIGDVTLGFTYFTPERNANNHFSITGSLIIPFYQNVPLPSNLSTVTPPFVGFQSVGAELKLSYAGNAQNFIPGCYYDLSAGVRQYFSTYGPSQLFFDATLGVNLDEDWQVLGNLSGVSSNSNYTTTTTTDGVNRDYGYFRVRAGVGRRINKDMQLFAGIFQDVSGRNIGRGSGFYISAVFHF